MISRRSIFGLMAGAAVAPHIPVAASAPDPVVIGVDFGREAAMILAQSFPEEFTMYIDRDAVRAALAEKLRRPERC